MPAPDHHELDRCRLDLVEAALRTDPALEEELELIVALLDPEATREFWRTFADGCERCERPAAVVLAALEQAAVRGGGGAA